MKTAKKKISEKKVPVKKAVSKKPALKSAADKEKATKAVEGKITELLKRGRERGFVTYSEILYYFPTIEDDIMLLEDLYGRFEQENIEILESKEFLSGGDPIFQKKKGRKGVEFDFELLPQDSVQLFLRKRGRFSRKYI